MTNENYCRFNADRIADVTLTAVKLYSEETLISINL